MEPKNVTIGKLTYYINQLKPRKALRLDKVIAELIAEAIGGVGPGIKDWGNLQVDVVFTAFAGALRSMSEDRFISFIMELFSCVQAQRPKTAPEEITEDTFDSVFIDVPLTEIYQLAYEVMRRNHFSPFDLAERAGIGNLIKTILSSAENESKPANDGIASEKSATSQKS